MAAIPPSVYGVLFLGTYISFCSAGIIYCRLKCSTIFCTSPATNVFYEEYSASKYSRLATLFLLVYRACPIMFVVFTPR